MKIFITGATGFIGTHVARRLAQTEHELSVNEFNKMVRDISGVRLPGMHLPDFVVMINARLLTWLADIIKKPPPWGMSVDQIRTMKEGFRVDGSKAERELDITYTPVRQALEEAIASYQR
jgi:nucleoside-diphosphate-sugar epimerase